MGKDATSARLTQQLLLLSVAIRLAEALTRHYWLQKRGRCSPHFQTRLREDGSTPVLCKLTATQSPIM